jgi:hypothetical protein
MESVAAAGRTAVVFLGLVVGSIVAVAVVVAGFGILAAGVYLLVHALGDISAWLVPGEYADLILPRF